MTTQHVGGFSLWDTAVSNYGVASSPCNKDIVREYVDAFRKRDFEIGLYYSIWNGHHGITRGNVTPEHVEHIKTQLRELMSNYGPIRLIWLDGYQNEKRGRSQFPNTAEVPFGEIYGLIKEIQPNCLVMRHKGLGYYDPEYTDVQIWEYLFSHQETWDVWERFQKDHPGVVSEVCETLQPQWFWKEGMDTGDLLTADYVADKLEFARKHSANYILNVAVNRDGLFDENALKRLREIGGAVRAKGLLA
jgi:alpha-L-fucosidase